MKKILLVVTSVLFLFFSYASLAAKNSVATGAKIGVIDLNKILMESPQLTSAKEDLKKRFDTREKELVKSQKAFQKSLEDFNKNGPTMKADKKKAAEEKIIKEQQKLQGLQAKFQKDLGEAQNKAMQSILKKIEGIVKKTAESRKLDLVITKASVAYNKPELEVTGDIIKQLKAKPKAKTKKKK